MKYYEEGELVDKSPCARIRADLKKCLLESDCCRMKKKTPRQCLLDPEGLVPDECFLMRTSFFECRRSIVMPPNSMAKVLTKPASSPKDTHEQVEKIQERYKNKLL